MSEKAIDLRDAKSPSKAISIFKGATAEEKKELFPHLLEKASKAKNQAANEMYRKLLEEYRKEK